MRAAGSEGVLEVRRVDWCEADGALSAVCNLEADFVLQPVPVFSILRQIVGTRICNIHMPADIILTKDALVIRIKARRIAEHEVIVQIFTY